ncbi:MAG: 1-deoxy-D-xylulose-5-phosphate reductoisomerase [Deltaproteobacteria bacterium]
MKKISLLGSTGSIGSNVLKIVRLFPGRFGIVGLAACNNIELLRNQIEAFQPLIVSVGDRAKAEQLERQRPSGWSGAICHGQEGNIQVASMPEAEMTVSAIVGAAGLAPTMAAIQAGKDVALANKETLVMAGELVMREAAARGIALLPVDSEHNAIFQALSAGKRNEVAKIILTASGGPLRNQSEKKLWDVTPEMALNHPNWAMGKKISIDSATLMNKGLELIEAKWLFAIDPEKIEILVHPQSIVHSMVEFIDGSIVAQMGIPDMRIPIAYALSYPERIRTELPPLNLAQIGSLQFLRPDFNKFPALRLAYQVCRQGGTLPAAFNAANEVAVEAFLAGRIRFPEITLTVAETVHRMERKEVADLAVVFEADLAARLQADSIVEALHLTACRKKGGTANCPELPPKHHLAGQN